MTPNQGLMRFASCASSPSVIRGFATLPQVSSLPMVFTVCFCPTNIHTPLAFIPVPTTSLLLQGPLYRKATIKATVTRAYLPFSLFSCLVLLIWTVYCLKHNIQQP